MPDSQQKHSSPPYATFAPFMNFINKLRENGIPSRIDPSVFGNASGSVSYSVIAALKSLKLIEANGVPSDTFAAFVNADDESRKPLFKEAMKNAYPTLHGGGFPLAKATAAQFDEHLRENYVARGSTIDKVATFFIHAAEYADIPVSDLIKNRKPSTASNGSPKGKKAKRPEPLAPAAAPTPEATISDNALEYKLVDLMREEGISDEQRNAIWVLLQFLTARKTKKAVEQ